MASDETDLTAADCSGRRLTYLQWLTCQEVGPLLSHAVPLISRQHLSLVLAQISMAAWPHWHRWHPDDWRPSWSLSTLTAWCFGAASFDDVCRARNASWNARSRWPESLEPGHPPSSVKAGAAATAMALATSYATDRSGSTWDVEWHTCASSDPANATVFWAASARPTPEVDALFAAARAVSAMSNVSPSPALELAAGDAWDAEQLAQDRVTRVWQAEMADELRRLIPYPTRPSTAWRVKGNTVLAGHAILRMDGWTIVSTEHADDAPTIPATSRC